MPNKLQQMAGLLGSPDERNALQGGLLGLADSRQGPGLRMYSPAIVGALPSGRPVGREPNGDIATVKMMTDTTPSGTFINYPSYWAQDVNPLQALALALRNNYPMPEYPTEEEAVQASIRNSRSTGQRYRYPGYGLRVSALPVDLSGE